MPEISAEDVILRKRKNWPETCTPIADLMIRLYRVRDLVYEYSRRHVKQEFGLTRAEFEVVVTMRTVEAPYRLTPTQLQKALLITPGGITKVLHNLERRGLITRSRDSSDGRTRAVKLTPKGIELAEAVLPMVLEDCKQQLSLGLDAAQMRELSKLLRAALKGLEGPPKRG